MAVIEDKHIAAYVQLRRNDIPKFVGLCDLTERLLDDKRELEHENKQLREKIAKLEDTNAFLKHNVDQSQLELTLLMQRLSEQQDETSNESDAKESKRNRLEDVATYELHGDDDAEPGGQTVNMLFEHEYAQQPKFSSKAPKRKHIQISVKRSPSDISSTSSTHVAVVKQEIQDDCDDADSCTVPVSENQLVIANRQGPFVQRNATKFAYHCATCGYRFKSKVELSSHMRYHAKSQPVGTRVFVRAPNITRLPKSGFVLGFNSSMLRCIKQLREGDADVPPIWRTMLPVRYREAAALIFEDGKTFTEASEECNIKRVTLRWNICQVMKRLKSLGYTKWKPCFRDMQKPASVKIEDIAPSSTSSSDFAALENGKPKSKSFKNAKPLKSEPRSSVEPEQNYEDALELLRTPVASDHQKLLENLGTDEMVAAGYPPPWWRTEPPPKFRPPLTAVFERGISSYAASQIYHVNRSTCQFHCNRIKRSLLNAGFTDWEGYRYVPLFPNWEKTGWTRGFSCKSGKPFSFQKPISAHDDMPLSERIHASVPRKKQKRHSAPSGSPRATVKSELGSDPPPPLAINRVARLRRRTVLAVMSDELAKTEPGSDQSESELPEEENNDDSSDEDYHD